ncbi:VOC family protein [Sanguibacter suaedae]|uniref:VOC family protein n=1 Tax=Sanguibacter suaedae TaxID=2795737 RepID=A0A934I3W4_9MICO|nr:VOC family protein [Sanguibacter suaedae]MBI9113761.1 VOC family protein [Sanguibacter suaedae]
MTLRLGFIGIVTTDMRASLAFYRALGVPVPDGVDDAPHVDATLDGGVALAWDTVDTIRSFDPAYEPPTGGHRIALAFDQGTPDAVDATVASLAAQGYPPHVAPWDAPWGQRYATVLDPDGNSVDLYALLPTS